MRMRPNLVAGVTAAALALAACGVAADTSGRTHRDHAAPVSARHAPADTSFAELKDLAQLKRVTAWKAADAAGARQPQMDTSGFADLRDLAQAKRDASWKAAEHAWGR